jgi:predicted nucleic acid-binding protein
MLLDTSGLYCYLDAGDARHRDTVALLDASAVRLTHNYVLAELVALCNARRIDRQVTLEFVSELADDPNVAMAWVGPDEYRSAIELLRARPDKDYSLCDAISFLLMRQRGITEALTTDRDFEQEGFVRLLRSS